jgi:hypothetical protein
MNLRDRKFGRLSPICPIKKDRWGKSRWLCICDCGVWHECLQGALLRGYTQSCGCYRQDKAREMGKNSWLIRSQKVLQVTCDE